MKRISASLLVLSSFLVAPRALAICDNPPCIRLPNLPNQQRTEAVCEAKLIKEITELSQAVSRLWKRRILQGDGYGDEQAFSTSRASRMISSSAAAGPASPIAISQNDKLVFAKSYGFGDMQRFSYRIPTISIVWRATASNSPKPRPS